MRSATVVSLLALVVTLASCQNWVPKQVPADTTTRYRFEWSHGALLRYDLQDGKACVYAATAENGDIARYVQRQPVGPAPKTAEQFINKHESRPGGELTFCAEEGQSKALKNPFR